MGRRTAGVARDVGSRTGNRPARGGFPLRPLEVVARKRDGGRPTAPPDRAGASAARTHSSRTRWWRRHPRFGRGWRPLRGPTGLERRDAAVRDGSERTCVPAPFRFLPALRELRTAGFETLRAKDGRKLAVDARGHSGTSAASRGAGGAGTLTGLGSPPPSMGGVCPLVRHRYDDPRAASPRLYNPRLPRAGGYSLSLGVDRCLARYATSGTMPCLRPKWSGSSMAGCDRTGSRSWTPGPTVRRRSSRISRATPFSTRRRGA